MLLKRTIHKTKILLHKTLQSIKLFLIGGYQKLPKATSLNIFSASSNHHPKVQQLDSFYRDLCDQYESDCNKLTPRKSKSTVSEKEISSGENFVDSKHMVFKKKEEKRGTEEHKIASSQSGNRGGSHALARKMRELEMMDVHDVDHVLDIEEVLHYYSRLKSPVYQELVDTFFMDMYSEFTPQPSASTNSSMRRLAPLKI